MFLLGKKMEKNKQLKFLLIGDGFIAPRHKEAISEIGGELVGVIDKDKGENAWKSAILEKEAQYVVILTPNDLHFEISKFAAENGKIVLCEKPLAIKTSDVIELDKFPNIFSVLQLRYHPDIEKIKAEIKKDFKNDIEMNISVYRDENYYNGWKGKIEKSGGPLFNLGVHYFDLLLYIFGDEKIISLDYLSDKTGKGKIEGDNYICNFTISTDAERKNQKRVFRINDKQYNFSSQDNLSYENLHRFVYEDLINGMGVRPKEALKAINLIENLYKNYNEK
jgi:UDP-N-acetyl-2-amino-2-deoxyglucuronate dehydrogenase